MKEEFEVVATLPVSTAKCDYGPEITYKPEELTLRYDSEGDEGTLWTTIVFLDVVGYKWTTDISKTEYMRKAYSRILWVKDSKWIMNLKSEAEKHDYHFGSDYHHYIVYFDHHGCLEIACATFEIRGTKEN